MLTLRKTLLAGFPFPTGAAALLLASTATLAETEQRDLTDFDAIEVSGGVDLDLTQGTGFSVVVETDDGELDDIVTKVRNGTLHIYLEHSWYDRDNWHTDYRAAITLPALTELEASGGSDVVTTGTFTGNALDVSASGGSDLELDLAVDRLELTASGGSDMEISGTANYLEAESSGGSDLDASRLSATTVDATASGGSDLDINVSGSLTARASGGSDIRYEGDPQERDIDTSWGADVRRR